MDGLTVWHMAQAHSGLAALDDWPGSLGQGQVYSSKGSAVQQAAHTEGSRCSAAKPGKVSAERTVDRNNCKPTLPVSSNPAPVQAAWSQLWRGQPQRRHVILAVHYAWAMYILLFNSMVLNITAYGQTHIHMNTVVIGEQSDCLTCTCCKR